MTEQGVLVPPVAHTNNIRTWMRRWVAAWRVADGCGASSGLTHRTLWLETGERLFVSVWFLGFVYRMSAGFLDAPNVIVVLLVVSEALPFLYIVLRLPSATLSQRPTDWCFGILGSVLPLLVLPAVSATPLVHVPVCFGIMVVGMSLQVMAKLILGCSFGIVAANRGVRVLGPYRFIRHPMYAGYTITHVGFLLAMPSPVNALIYATALTMQVARIFREERLLGQDAGYREFAGHVRYRLVPGIF